ncbi:hypothetical protein NP233_g289 [Leucocoprinus birnbaumii]|uniref:Uncharacterized protein n=1 Tax=Leucocoprinus birnbaumii TaxID=56174 RepID=A0AAD5W379_9AGAR|nr:hypothetical protein NP233_g289 [Leucocoprinus birnbaumii]
MELRAALLALVSRQPTLKETVYLPLQWPTCPLSGPGLSARVARTVANATDAVAASTAQDCFNVRCTGSLDGETRGACTGNTIKVKIIDACPATHPANYCKTAAFGGNIPDREACEASGTNALDIATTARSALSSFQGNLNIDIQATSC